MKWDKVKLGIVVLKLEVALLPKAVQQYILMKALLLYVVKTYIIFLLIILD